MLLRGRLTPRRKALLVTLAVLLLVIGWMSWTGMAVTRGVQTREMDWDGDGQVSRTEIAQAFYAVTATRTQEGARECTTFHWRRSGEVIRVDCRTVFQNEDPAPPAAR